MYGLNLPSLTAGNHTLTSPATAKYNCVSHALHEEFISLWPDENNRWPDSITFAETLDAFAELFNSVGFEEISKTDHSYVLGFEKIAIFSVDGIPSHVSRQLNNGRWTSKLGTLADIGHSNLSCLENGEYGMVTKVMIRKQVGKPIIGPVTPKRPLLILPD